LKIDWRKVINIESLFSRELVILTKRFWTCLRPKTAAANLPPTRGKNKHLEVARPPYPNE
jgi:hypothetical protein